MTREDRRSLALHRAIADHLTAHPTKTLHQARRNLALMRDRNPQVADLFTGWEDILSRPVEAIVAAMLDPGQRARDLRKVTPFAGVLEPQERTRVYREFARRDAAARSARLRRSTCERSHRRTLRRTRRATRPNFISSRAGCAIVMSRYHDFMTRQTTVRLPEELADDAEAVARINGISVNALIVDALTAEIERVRRDEDFTNRAKRLLERDKELLERLAQ